MNNDASFNDAKRLYLESCGDPMVTNTYLKIALVLVSLVALGLALVDLKTIRTFQKLPPTGDPHRRLGSRRSHQLPHLEYKPQDAEAKYFLSQFCTLYYRRNRYTIQETFRSPCTSLTASWPTASSMPTARTTSSRSSSRTLPHPKSMWT